MGACELDECPGAEEGSAEDAVRRVHRSDLAAWPCRRRFAPLVPQGEGEVPPRTA